MATPTSEKILQCVVVTPERAVVDDAADFVALPMYDGELGVLPGRAPLIGRLGYGELRIRRGAETKRFFVDGGFAQVRANVVTVLTQRAQRDRDIDAAAAANSLQAAAAPNAAAADQAKKTRDQERARAQLRIARKAGHSA